MLPYYLLISIPLLFTFVAMDRTAPARPSLCIGSNRLEHIQQQNMALPVFFILLFLMLACRAESVGTDLRQYRIMFEVYADQSLQYFDLIRTESLFRLLNWTVGQLTDSYQVFLTVMAALTLTPIAILYCEDRHHSFMKIILFVGMSTFVMLFSGIRQMLAVALGVIAYMFVRKKKLILFLITVVIALGVHHSSFMILLMYPLYHIRFKKNHLWFILPMLVAVFLLNRQIFGVMNVVLASFDETYEAVSVSSTGAYMSLLLFGAFAAFAYIVPDESQMDAELYGLRNFLLAAVFLQCFAPVHALAMRLNYYFIIFIPIFLAKVVQIPQQRYVRISKLAAIIITAYFAIDFMRGIYSGYVTGTSALNTVPYVPFWV